MREPHRLRALEVRVARHQRVDVRARLRDAARGAARRSRRSMLARRRARTAADRSRPDRCGCAPVCSRRPASPISSISRASTFMWTSSSASSHASSPDASCASTLRSPATIAAASSAVIRPRAASISACAIEPATSCGSSRRSKSIEALSARRGGIERTLESSAACAFRSGHGAQYKRHMTNTQRVTFPSSAGEASGVLATPDGSAGVKPPGVVVIQEWWGVNEQIQAVADALRRRRLRRGRAGPLSRQARQGRRRGRRSMMKALDFGKAVQEIAGAVAFLARSLGNGKVAVTGYCMGGALALATACNIPGLAAVVPFYGLPAALDWSKITAPVQAHFAEHDEWATVDGRQEDRGRGQGHGAPRLRRAARVLQRAAAPRSSTPTAARKRGTARGRLHPPACCIACVHACPRLYCKQPSFRLSLTGQSDLPSARIVCVVSRIDQHARFLGAGRQAR